MVAGGISGGISGGIQISDYISGGIGKTKELLPKPIVVSGGLEVCFGGGLRTLLGPFKLLHGR